MCHQGACDATREHLSEFFNSYGKIAKKKTDYVVKIETESSCSKLGAGGGHPNQKGRPRVKKSE